MDCTHHYDKAAARKMLPYFTGTLLNQRRKMRLLLTMNCIVRKRASPHVHTPPALHKPCWELPAPRLRPTMPSKARTDFGRAIAPCRSLLWVLWARQGRGHVSRGQQQPHSRAAVALARAGRSSAAASSGRGSRSSRGCGCSLAHGRNRERRQRQWAAGRRLCRRWVQGVGVCCAMLAGSNGGSALHVRI